MKRLSKLIPRSTGGRWAAGLSLAGLVGIGIYLVFFVFAFHLIFVDEVVDEEAPEFASEADIDELISEALDVAAATAGGARTTDSDREATEQPMSVGEHEVEGSDADGSDSAGAAEGSSTGLVDESSDGAESGEAYSSAADGSQTTSADEGHEETGGSDASGTDDGGLRVSHVGSFGPRSHPAEGAVVVLTDGTQTVLRFDDSFATDNGPDLNVYLHTAGPDASVDDLVADFIDLGDLKGNIGAQNYVVPDVNLDRYSTVSVWCVRFRVVFGTAELMPMS